MPCRIRHRYRRWPRPVDTALYFDDSWRGHSGTSFSWVDWLAPDRSLGLVMGKRKPDQEKSAVGWWEFLRDVLIAAINRGQLPTALFGAIIILMMWRMPPEDVGKLSLEIVTDLKQGHLAGYFV